MSGLHGLADHPRLSHCWYRKAVRQMQPVAVDAEACGSCQAALQCAMIQSRPAPPLLVGRAADGPPRGVQLEVQLRVVQPQRSRRLPRRPPPLRQPVQRPDVVRHLPSTSMSVGGNDADQRLQRRLMETGPGCTRCLAQQGVQPRRHDPGATGATQGR